MHTMRFCEATDIYSYGMTLLEVAQEGGRPLQELESAVEVLLRVENGYTVLQPPGCSDYMYALITF